MAAEGCLQQRFAGFPLFNYFPRLLVHPTGTEPQVTPNARTLPVPSPKTIRAVRFLVKLVRLEDVAGYFILAANGLALGSFGEKLERPFFWIFFAQIVWETATKYVRYWENLHLDLSLRCSDIFNNPFVLGGLYKSAALLILSVIGHAGLAALFAAFFFNWEDVGSGRLLELEYAILALSFARVVVGIYIVLGFLSFWGPWTLSQTFKGLMVEYYWVMYFSFMITSPLTTILLVVSFVRHMINFCAGKAGKDDDNEEEAGARKDDDNKEEAGAKDWMVKLVLYVHYRRHKTLQGHAAQHSDKCGLPSKFTITPSELEVALKNHIEDPEVNIENMNSLVEALNEVKDFRTSVAVTDMQGGTAEDVIRALYKLRGLERLFLFKVKSTVLPPAEANDLPNLAVLSIASSSMTSIPPSLFVRPKLRKVHLSYMPELKIVREIVGSQDGLLVSLSQCHKMYYESLQNALPSGCVQKGSLSQNVEALLFRFNDSFGNLSRRLDVVEAIWTISSEIGRTMLDYQRHGWSFLPEGS